jgi:hypothetical protein
VARFVDCMYSVYSRYLVKEATRIAFDMTCYCTRTVLQY